MKRVKDTRLSEDFQFSVIEEVLTDQSSAWSVGIRNMSDISERPIMEIPVVSKELAYELFEQLYKAAELT